MPRIVPSTPASPKLEDVVTQWVGKYGEAITQIKAGELLGLDKSTICRMVRNKILPATPHNRVLVAPMAEWAYKDYCSNQRGKRRIALLPSQERRASVETSMKLDTIPIAEVARELGIAPMKVKSAIKNGTLPIGCVCTEDCNTKEQTVILKVRWEKWKAGEL